jgi:glycerol uptake facilitator-like aquaporin
LIEKRHQTKTDTMARVKELQQYLTQGLAECFATFMLILIGESAIAQYKLGRQQNHSTITINLGFGIAVYTGSCSLLSACSHKRLIIT